MVRTSSQALSRKKKASPNYEAAKKEALEVMVKHAHHLFSFSYYAYSPRKAVADLKKQLAKGNMMKTEVETRPECEPAKVTRWPRIIHVPYWRYLRKEYKITMKESRTIQFAVQNVKRSKKWKLAEARHAGNLVQKASREPKVCRKCMWPGSPSCAEIGEYHYLPSYLFCRPHYLAVISAKPTKGMIAAAAAEYKEGTKSQTNAPTLPTKGMIAAAAAEYKEGTKSQTNAPRPLPPPVPSAYKVTCSTKEVLTRLKAAECRICCEPYKQGPDSSGHRPTTMPGPCGRSICMSCAELYRAAQIEGLAANRKMIKCMFCKDKFHSEKHIFYPNRDLFEALEEFKSSSVKTPSSACRICCEQYNQGPTEGSPADHRPTTMPGPCGRSICMSCAELYRAAQIEGLAANRKMIKCMFCNDLFHCEKHVFHPNRDLMETSTKRKSTGY